MNVEVSIKTGIRLFDNKEHEDKSLNMLHRLVAVGANATISGYLEQDKKLIKDFSESTLKIIAPIWNHLDDRVKIKVLTDHSDEFNQWILEKEND